MTIVIAWVDELGQRRAEVLLQQGTTGDFTAALRETRATGRRVYTYQTTETNPLHRARQDLAYDLQYSSACYRRYHPLAG